VWLTCERLTDLGDIAVAIGNGSVAQATGGILDTAFADGTDSEAFAEGGSLDSATTVGTETEADAGFGGSLDSATAVDGKAFAEGGSLDSATASAGGVAGFLGSNDTAFVLGTGSTADAGADFSAAGNFDLGAAFGDMLNSTGATGGNFLVDIATIFGTL